MSYNYSYTTAPSRDAKSLGYIYGTSGNKASISSGDITNYVESYFYPSSFDLGTTIGTYLFILSGYYNLQFKPTGQVLQVQLYRLRTTTVGGAQNYTLLQTTFATAPINWANSEAVTQDCGVYPLNMSMVIEHTSSYINNSTYTYQYLTKLSYAPFGSSTPKGTFRGVIQMVRIA